MSSALGAYGFRLEGVESAVRWLVPQPTDAPSLRLVTVHGPLPDRRPVVDERHADLGLVEGVWFEAHAHSEVVTFTSTRLIEASELVHPMLAPAASLHWLWRGDEALHAGAVLVGGGAVLLLGNREAGKSTTLAAMAEAGFGVLTDDLVVVTEDLTMPVGPRAIDRRLAPKSGGESPDPAVIGAEAVRSGTRLRQILDPVALPTAIPIRGWVALGWGEAVDFVPLTAAERLEMLALARRVRGLPGRPATVLDLAGLPAYRLVRPRRPDQIEPAIALLVKHFN